MLPYREKYHNQYVLHQLLWCFFPDEKKRQFIFRSNDIEDGFEVFLISEKKHLRNTVQEINTKKLTH